MKIKYCVFDIINVCYPYSSAVLNAFVRELVPDKEAFDKENGLASFNIKPLLKGEINFTQFCKNLCDYYHIPYQKQIETNFNIANHRSLGSFIDVTKQLISELQTKGVEICLMSNIPPNLKDIIPNGVNKDKCFLSYELGLIKPDPKIFEIVLQKLKAKPQEVLFIDDSSKNVEVAQNFGIKGIVFDKDNIIKKVRNLLLYETISRAPKEKIKTPTRMRKRQSDGQGE